jgi:hypothetical protein
MEKQMIEGKVRLVPSDTLKVELTRGMRGTYGWTISVKGNKSRHTELLAKIREIDTLLKEQYPVEEG